MERNGDFPAGGEPNLNGAANAGASAVLHAIHVRPVAASAYTATFSYPAATAATAATATTEPEIAILVENEPGTHHLSTAGYWLARGRYVWSLDGRPVLHMHTTWERAAPDAAAEARMLATHPPVTMHRYFHALNHPGAFARQSRGVDEAARALGVGVRRRRWPADLPANPHALPRNGPLDIETRPVQSLSRAELACRNYLHHLCNPALPRQTTIRMPGQNGN